MEAANKLDLEGGGRGEEAAGEEGAGKRGREEGAGKRGRGKVRHCRTGIDGTGTCSLRQTQAHAACTSTS